MNKILIPVDFEKQSLIALEQSLSLAHLILAEITLLYVHEPSGIFSSIFSDDQKSEMLIIIEQRLSEIAKKTSASSGLEVNIRIEKGKIYSKIVEVAKEINAQFIFMGTNGSDRESKQGNAIGANTSRVVRASSCPVITINADHIYPECRNIILPLDLTDESRQKVPLAVEIARFYGAGIKVVSALWKKNEKAESGRIYQLGEQVTTFIASAGINCTFEIIECKDEEKTTVPAILRYAKEHGDIGMLIIMTHQEPGLVEYFVGSESQEFIRLSDIPVMSVTPRNLGLGAAF